jgi:hypothetical protein
MTKELILFLINDLMASTAPFIAVRIEMDQYHQKTSRNEVIGNHIQNSAKMTHTSSVV